MGALFESSVSLRIFGDDLDPDQVTAALGYPPAIAVRRGALWRPSLDARERLARTGSWRRHVPRRRPGDLDGQVAEIFAPLTTDMTIWRHLTSTFKADLFCGLFLQKDNEGIGLSPQTLLAVGQ